MGHFKPFENDLIDLKREKYGAHISLQVNMGHY